MAGYGYTHRGYSTYNGLGQRRDDWNKPSYASDHVCKPVIVDAEGRKKPIISYNSPNYNNTDYFVTKTETIVESVHSPLAAGEYRQHSPTRVEPYKDYRVHEDNKWRKPSSSPVHDRPQQVDEFLTKIQTEASRPKFGPLSATHWRQTPISTSYQGNNNTGYGDYNGLSNKEFQKPSRHENYDDYYRKNGSTMEPTVITNGGWARPSHTMWSSPPDSSLTKPTNDIGQAMEYLKEAARSPVVTSTPQSGRFTVPVSTGPKRGAYIETIREAARPYSNFKLPARRTDQS